MVKTIIILITKYFSNKKIMELKIDRQPPPNGYMKKLDCSHEWFDFNENGETVCGGCGNHVSLICDDDGKDPYFEILNKQSDGTYIAFHRSYRDQTALHYNFLKIN